MTTIQRTRSIHSTDTTETPVRRDRRPDLALLVAFPLVWAAVLLLHPVGEPSDVYRVIDERLGAWMFVHLTMVACIPLMALAVHRLVRGIDSTAARICRWAVPVFAVTYGVFEALMGLATGIFVASSDGDPSGLRAEMLRDFIESRWLELFELTSTAALGIAVVGAAFALQRVRAIGTREVVLLLLAAPGIAIHAPPFGPIGLALFVVAVLPLVRRDAPGAPGSARE